MIKSLLKLMLLLICSLVYSQTFVNTKKYASYDEYPVYEGEDLGVNYTPEQTIIKLWSPNAEEVKLHLYENPYGGRKLSEEKLYLTNSGVWEIVIKGDSKNIFYTYINLLFYLQ